MEVKTRLLQSDCGVFGIWNHPEAATKTAIGLHAQQHRGQEGTGVVTFDGTSFHKRRKRGLVMKSFFDGEVLEERLLGRNAIGHVRYSTVKGSPHSDPKINIQPLYADVCGGVAIAHNGNLTNALALRKTLTEDGAVFYTDTDTEVFLPLIARAGTKDLVSALLKALKYVEGAYSLVLLGRDCLIGVRDPYGIRPLVLGKLDGAPVLASETCALNSIRATFIRDIAPGEIFCVTNEGTRSINFGPLLEKRFCVFEYVYFARPDSVIERKSVAIARKRMGVKLAQECPAVADIVVPVPDSGVPAALGYAEECGIPYTMGIIRSHYVGRTFIEPSQEIRDMALELKLSPDRAVLEGKRIALVDDSIVRGTTSKKIVDMVREFGAREVHVRVASPPFRFSCFYGIDTPDRNELLGARMDVSAMCKYIGADSLGFLSIDGLYRAMGESARNEDSPQYCDACFTGDYPIPIPTD